MTRDMDLIRGILLQVEQYELPIVPAGPQGFVRVDSYDLAATRYHVRLLHQEGYLEGAFGLPFDERGVPCYTVALTWKGHDFLDSIRNEVVWAKTLARLGKTIGTASLEVVKEVASEIGKRLILGDSGS